MKLTTIIVFATAVVFITIVFNANRADGIPKDKLMRIKKLAAVGILLKGKKKFIFPLPLPLPLPIPIFKKTQKIIVKQPVPVMMEGGGWAGGMGGLTPGSLGGGMRGLTPGGLGGGGGWAAGMGGLTSGGLGGGGGWAGGMGGLGGKIDMKDMINGMMIHDMMEMEKIDKMEQIIEQMQMMEKMEIYDKMEQMKINGIKGNGVITGNGGIDGIKGNGGYNGANGGW